MVLIVRWQSPRIPGRTTTLLDQIKQSRWVAITMDTADVSILIKTSSSNAGRGKSIRSANKIVLPVAGSIVDKSCCMQKVWMLWSFCSRNNNP